MLTVIGESPLASLDGNLSVDARIASDILDEATRDVLAEGWNFNKEERTLTADSDGYITVPGNAMAAFVDKVSGSNIDPVLRGTRLYDKYNNTFEFTVGSEWTVGLILALDFEECPEVMRQYIMVRAARIFQDRRMPDRTQHQFTLQDEMVARAKAMKADNADSEYSIFDSPDVGQIVARRGRPYRPNG